MFTTFVVVVVVYSTLVNAKDPPFYTNQVSGDPFVNRIRIADYNGPSKDVSPDLDANGIIGPIMTPFMDMFDMMQQNAKARAYAAKLEKDKEDSPFTSSKSIFEMLEKLQRPPTTTTPQPPLIERLLKPYIEPWQHQLDVLSKDMTGITLVPTTTTTTKAPVTPRQSILEKSLAVFFPSLRGTTTTTPAPTTKSPASSLFDEDLLKRLLFAREKRQVRREKRQLQLPNPPLISTWDKSMLELSNPFTPNPIMSMFTMKPLPELKLPKVDTATVLRDPLKPLAEPKFKLQDPFYNPLYPNRKSKLFDLLAGGEALRLLG